MPTMPKDGYATGPGAHRGNDRESSAPVVTPHAGHPRGRAGGAQVRTARVRRRRGLSTERRYSPPGACAKRFTCRPSARIPTRRTPLACRATTVRAAVQLHAERHGTCNARAGEPRSIPERACFTTCPDATLTCAAREVTLYLAVASPSSSRVLPCPLLSSTALLRRVGSNLKPSPPPLEFAVCLDRSLKHWSCPIRLEASLSHISIVGRTLMPRRMRSVDVWARRRGRRRAQALPAVGSSTRRSHQVGRSTSGGNDGLDRTLTPTGDNGAAVARQTDPDRTGRGESTPLWSLESPLSRDRRATESRIQIARRATASGIVQAS
jgi:hypothetical protein